MGLSNKERIRILIADDEEAIRFLYERILSSAHPKNKVKAQINKLDGELFSGEDESVESFHYSYDLTLVSQSKEALDAVVAAEKANDPFAIAYLDVRMPPGPNGLWAAKEIRTISEDIQIVIVTGFSDVEVSKMDKNVPPSHKMLYIQKPFHHKEILNFSSALSSKWKVELLVKQTHANLKMQVSAKTEELESALKRIQKEVCYNRQLEEERERLRKIIVAKDFRDSTIIQSFASSLNSSLSGIKTFSNLIETTINSQADKKLHEGFEENQKAIKNLSDIIASLNNPKT